MCNRKCLRPMHAPTLTTSPFVHSTHAAGLSSNGYGRCMSTPIALSNYLAWSGTATKASSSVPGRFRAPFLPSKINCTNFRPVWRQCRAWWSRSLDSVGTCPARSSKRFSSPPLTHNECTHLRAILCGTVQTRCRLVLAGHVKSATCPRCLGQDEDVEHIFWRCPSWAEAHAKVQSKDDASLLDRLPACTRQCGVAVVPESEVDTSIAPLIESQSFPCNLIQTSHLVMSSG